MVLQHQKLRQIAFGGLLLASTAVVTSSAQAEGIVAKVVGSPLNSAGMVSGGYTALNVYLQKPEAAGVDFFNPEVPGFGIPAGGRIEVEMVSGFKRDPGIAMDAAAVHMVSGTPQQGLSDRRLGYVSKEGANPNIFSITANSSDGLPAEKLLPRATVQKLDPIPNIGLKVFHVGLRTIAFTNQGDKGVVAVRIVDGKNKVIARGQADVIFWDSPRPTIHPNNFLHRGRNHNWQRIGFHETLGVTAGSVPLTFMLFGKPTGSQEQIQNHRVGIVGAGVLSTQQLKSMNYSVPAPVARYNGGLIVKDRDGDGRLDPRKDQIIGGVIGKAPAGATGQEARSIEVNGRSVMSQPTSVFSQRAGERIGGAIMQVEFKAGSKPGKYRPTFALLKDPSNINSGDGSSYTYTIIVR